nr:hypothetical protein [Tanacetum cinerariifolium]
MHKAFPLPVMEFPLPEEVPTASEERSTSDGTGKKKGRTVTLTTDDMQKRKNDVKVRTTLLLAFPDEHQLRFSKHKTTQELWAAILKTFDGNEATRKTKKNLLKQQYGNFKAEGSETLEQTFNRLQVIVSHLEFMDIEIEKDDLNQKFLTSLPPEWLMHMIVWRNRSDLDTMSLDDLYNHLKVYESKVQKKSESNSQNMAFISSAKHSSGNEDVNIASVSTASTNVSTASANIRVTSISQDTAYAYIASQSSGKFEQWQFRIQQYLQHKHYALWEVIEFGDSYEAPGDVATTGSASDGAGKKKGMTVTLTTDDMQKRENDVKARTTLMLSLPDKHQLRFTKHISGNEEVNIASVSTASTNVSTASADIGVASISQDTACAYIASQSSALLSMRADRFWKKTRKKLSIQGTDVAGFDKSKVECFNCHKMGHIARECRAPRSQDRERRDNYRKGSKVKEHALKALMAIDGDWHKLRLDLLSIEMKNSNTGSSQNNIDDKGYWDSGCSRHISYLSDYEPFDEGYVPFGQGGCKITGKGNIITDKLEFENVDFKLLDDANVLLRTPRQHNMYSIDLNNSVPYKDLTCLVAKASVDEGMLWYRRLGHLYFNTMNRLVRHNLVRGLPSKSFENNHTCIACLKGKQHKASCKSKLVKSVAKPLHTLHMDLFGPTSVSSISHKWYCLVVTDDFSRFTWTFFLKTKDETSGILRKFINKIENLKDLKVKIIRCDNGGEFRNKEMDDFCSQKGIKREFSNAMTPQQNGVAERRNKTLIEAARTMLADAKLPVTFWAEAVNTACYVQNRVLVNKSHNKTPYELFNGRSPAIVFLKPFGCHVMILNTLDHLGKFKAKGDEGYFIGYSMSSKSFRVFNKRNKRVEENLHVEFLENKAIEKGAGPNWLFDFDSLTKSMNYVPVVAGTNF